MRILAVNSSPNKNGSTAKLLDVFLDICLNMGAEPERIDLQDYLVDDCSNCKRCITEGECICNDDFIQLKAKLLNADAIIVGSPFFSGEPSEDLKTFVNRLVHISKESGFLEDKLFIGMAVSLSDDPIKIAKYCSNLGGMVRNGKVVGILNFSRVSNSGIRDIEQDEEVRKLMHNEAEKMMQCFKVDKLKGMDLL